jgi:ribosome-associated heat shock protein Hsp15
MPSPHWRSWGLAELRGGERQNGGAAEPRDAGASMRIDRFLWFVRIAKSRDVAQAMAEQGRMRIDGRPVDRAHAAVRVGNILTFMKAGDVRVVRVEALPARRGPPHEAQLCYAELETMATKESESQKASSN